jgi:hypothetical protein
VFDFTPYNVQFYPQYHLLNQKTEYLQVYIVKWMARALLGNGPVNTRDTRMQQWNEVLQPASMQRLGKEASAQVQWR